MSLRHNDSKHGTPRTRGRTWQRIRLQVLAEEPLCRACQAADRVTAAAEVDHIRAGMAGEPRFFAEENGHQLGTPATIEPTPNSHVFSERELDNMGRRR